MDRAFTSEQLLMARSPEELLLAASRMGADAALARPLREVVASSRGLLPRIAEVLAEEGGIFSIRSLGEVLSDHRRFSSPAARQYWL